MIFLVKGFNTRVYRPKCLICILGGIKTTNIIYSLYNKTWFLNYRPLHCSNQLFPPGISVFSLFLWVCGGNLAKFNRNLILKLIWP